MSNWQLADLGLARVSYLAQAGRMWYNQGLGVNLAAA